MTVLVKELRDALIDAGASPEKADKAAEAVAGYDTALASLRTDVRVMQALGGVTVALLLAILWQVVTLGQAAARLDEKLTGISQTPRS